MDRVIPAPPAPPTNMQPSLQPGHVGGHADMSPNSLNRDNHRNDGNRDNGGRNGDGRGDGGRGSGQGPH